MRRLLGLAVILLAVGAATAVKAAETRYGKGVEGATAVAVADLLAHPDGYVGKKVQVQGVVRDVCPMRGCWIDVEGAGGTAIRFKVNDGEIVFPVDAKGKKVRAEGVLTRQELSREKAIERARHLAEEKGEKFDPASIKGPQTIYQIDGTGAVVE